MNKDRLALLQLISEGNYLPQIHADYGDLRWLYGQGYIRYDWHQVSITDAGKVALAAQKAASHAPR